jgi:hypothetical protein
MIYNDLQVWEIEHWRTYLSGRFVHWDSVTFELVKLEPGETHTHTEEIWKDWLVHLNYTKCQNQDKPPKKNEKEKGKKHLPRLRLWLTCGDDF